MLDLSEVKWTKAAFEAFDAYLKTLADDGFQKFSEKIVRTPSRVLGIRIPQLRQIAHEIAKGDLAAFLDGVTVDSFEKSELYCLLLAKIKDERLAFIHFEKYLQFVDNWATCDLCCAEFKLVGKNSAAHWGYVASLTKSQHEFVVRSGVVLLMHFYAMKEYVGDVLRLMDEIRSDAYYVNMAQAWLIAEFYLVDAAKTEAYLKDNKLNKFTHNKALQKIRESLRVSEEDKKRLSMLKK